MESPHVRVQTFGQSIWYDSIRRGLITSGELHDLVTNGGVLGVTSNPAIFEKAIAGSSDYDQVLRALVRQGVGSAQALYERIAIEDIQLAADVLRSTYDRTGRRDGYISFEVSPYLAHDTAGTVEEGRRLFETIGRENVMIKVPATTQGIPAIRRLIGGGINVNVTLIFHIDVYRMVANAYLSGLEDLLECGGDPATVASVASFFISRIDSAIDHELTSRLDVTQDVDRRRQLKARLGKIAIANARLAYAHLRELRADARWKALEATGAGPQRLLWASTGTKNPQYSKTLYIDELIGPDTVNTVPAETFHTFAASGRPRASLTENWVEEIEQAQDAVDGLETLGISFKAVTVTLLAGGVRSFSDAFDKLLAAVEKKRQALLGTKIAQQQYELGEAQADVDAMLDEWRREGRVRRLWAKDPSVWTGTDENAWLGWLYVVEEHHDEADALETLVEDVRRAGFRHVMLLGMGGSSLCAEVVRQTFGRIDGYPELLVLDSVVPAQVKAFEKRIDPSHTLFLVSSKSGGTTETGVLSQYFWDRVSRAGAGDEAGRNFVAITDPGTTLHKRAKRNRFRSIRHGEPSIGGRYSAISNFGLVPAALMGVDVKAFLDRTDIMVQACASCVPPEANPGVTLGAVLGTLAKRGREKVTIVVSPSVRALGPWLEQLLAESTGKLGTGLIPIADERLGAPDVYGDDRLFVYVHLNSDRCPELDAGIAALAAAGHPVVRLSIDDRLDIGQAFFRWEIATAVAGSILGINPFDQPDVEAAKLATRRLMAAFEETGALPRLSPMASDGELALFALGGDAEWLQSAAASADLAALLGAHLARIRPGDYFALTAYLEMNDANHARLQAIRHAVRDAKRVATTLGYGPRFLHSTGQLHKGGPDTGVFLQLTADDAVDLQIPGQRYTFGVLTQAQAAGDFEVLAERGRRSLRVHLGRDPGAGLTRLGELVEHALRLPPSSRW